MFPKKPAFNKGGSGFKKKPTVVEKIGDLKEKYVNKRYKKKGKKSDADEDETEAEIVPQDYNSKHQMNIDPNNNFHDGHSDDENLSESETRKMVIDDRKKKSKGGAFQSFGLSYPVYKAVIRKGYKLPTPIQRKAIPVILEGKDVVAMARTGSGKTAAFLIPLFERLKAHSPVSAARALVLSPTRELATQTYKFAKEFGKFTDLKITVILGGDSMESQFEALHSSPDIIIATPGRLLHVLVEMSQKLNAVEYVVFDEADRLFEMGFAEQLREILNRLPEHRQTLLFSATLPQMLVDFAKAGLHEPTLIRLDVESKLSDQLKTSYLLCRDDNREAVLLYLLKTVIYPDEMTVIFVATKHHVDYLRELLLKADIEVAYVYSSLDMEARKDNVQMFRTRRVKVLLVTDVAARGIDIPLLDNVINFNFPAKPKLFVHRVGRVARAGRSGTAYSILSYDEFPYLESLHLFLDKPLSLATDENIRVSGTDGLVGSVPQTIIDEESEAINRWNETIYELQTMKKVCSNAYRHYLKSRPVAASESVRKAKALNMTSIPAHPIFQQNSVNTVLGSKTSSEARDNLLKSLKKFKPSATIFEINSNRKSSEAFDVMKIKRSFHQKVISKKCANDNLAKESEECEEIEQTKKDFKDKEFYLGYQGAGAATEEGLKLDSSSSRNELDGAVLEVTGDDGALLLKQKNAMKWDRKKKRFVRETLAQENDPKKKKIRTESGALIPASYKGDIYQKWKKNQNVDHQSDSDDDEKPKGYGRDSNKPNFPKPKGNGRPPRRELKNTEEILKVREKDEKKRLHLKKRRDEKGQRSESSSGGAGRGRDRGGGGMGRGRGGSGGGGGRGGGGRGRGGGSRDRDGGRGGSVGRGGRGGSRDRDGGRGRGGGFGGGGRGRGGGRDGGDRDRGGSGRGGGGGRGRGGGGSSRGRGGGSSRGGRGGRR